MVHGPSRKLNQEVKTACSSAETVGFARDPHAHSRPRLRDRFGICQWFHFEDYHNLYRSVSLLKQLGIRHLRTGISWADYLRPGGSKWYDLQFEALQEFELLVSIWHTPPSLSEGGDCASPPRCLKDYADFIDLIISRYQRRFKHVELWNEPNNRYKWNFVKYDPDWSKFGEMIGMAAYWAKKRGMTTLLGGIIPVDKYWLRLMQNYGVLEYIDKIAIHGFPGMWWNNHPNWEWYRDWKNWDHKLNLLGEFRDPSATWITETGFSTWQEGEDDLQLYYKQAQHLYTATNACSERTYWYSLIDLDPHREAIEGFHVDENEYHMGLVHYDGTLKLGYKVLQELLAQH